MKNYLITDIYSAPLPNIQDLTGSIFNRWTVLAYSGDYKWFCQCICGTIRKVRGDYLIHERSQSCGCLRREMVSARRRGLAFDHPVEYGAFQGAKSRCHNTKEGSYVNYGERGIEFHFESFAQFFEHIGPRPTPKHSLDRIDNEGHYEIGNVRWATHSEQMRNRRMSRQLTVNGRTASLQEWITLYSKSRKTVKDRIQRGWCETCAVTLSAFHLCPHTSHPANILAQKRASLG